MSNDEYISLESDYQTLKLDYAELEKVNLAKDDLLFAVSHDLRTPLTPIRSIVENMLSGIYGPITTKQAERLRTVLANVNRETRLILNLLDVARITKGKISLKPELLNFAKLTKNVIQMFEYNIIDKPIELVRMPFPDEENFSILVDRGKVEQILSNLIGNAIKFTEAGTITISTELKSDHIVVSVKDEGCGIPYEELDRIFERYYQIKNENNGVKGTGIGLSIVKEYVELHHGKVWVNSVMNEGSVFSFTLPKKVI